MMRFLAALALVAMISATAWAQAPAPAAPAPAAPTFSLRNPMVDAAIFVVLAGGAIYAACRPSSRV